MRTFYLVLNLCLLSLISADSSQNSVDPNKACESSQEWMKICDDCKCDMPAEPVLRNMDIDACKLHAERHGYDLISINKFNNNKCLLAYETWCPLNEVDHNHRDEWETHKLTVEKCPTLDTIVWSNMKGFDSVCSKSGYSIEIRVDQTLYALHDDDYVGEDCTTLCGSVGSVCLGGWGDYRNERCPVADEITSNFGCGNTNSNTFVCSCAAITSSGFVLIDGNPGSGGEVEEIFNPDPYQDLGEVQCCNSAARKCTRRDPWNSRSNSDCMSGNNDDVKYSFFEAISMCNVLGDDWSLCTRDEWPLCGGKGCNGDARHAWGWDPNAIQASKVINYDECTTINSVTGPQHESDTENWNTKCPENTAIVSVETRDLEPHNQYWSITKIQCCALVDKITESQYRIPGGQNYLQGGGNPSVEDQWEAQCGPNAIMVGIYNDDDSGDFDDIDATKCNTLECPYTCGEKIDNHDCVVVNLSPAALSSCPIDYVMVGLWDSDVTAFNRVRKMKCCRVLESILPTVSPTQMPTTDDPSECPTVSPTTSIPSMSPTTDDPTLYPSQNPTTEQPTDAPSVSPSTEEPSISPSRCPTSSDPTYHPSKSPSENPTTDSPTVSPTISPSTDQPTRFPSISPSTEEPTLFPTLSPSTDSPTKFPTRNPTTEDPTAFPSTPPTYAPTLCEPTCRSHADQMVNILGRLMDFNSELLESVKFRTSNDPLTNVLNEMILDLERLKDQMNIVHDDVIPIIPPIH